MQIGIDLSLRSTGLVAIDENLDVKLFGIINSVNKEDKTDLPVLNDEDLLIYNSQKIISFISNVNQVWSIDHINLEGLSFGGVSGSKDILQGNFWEVRCEITKKYSSIPVKIIPVTTWRSKVLNKDDRDSALAKYGKAKYLKEGCVDKLPDEVKNKFEEYISINKYKKASIYDLTDAYFIAKHGL